VTAPSPPRCARCGHVRHHHALLPWMPWAKRFGRCEHVLNCQPFYCNCPAYVAPKEGQRPPTPAPPPCEIEEEICSCHVDSHFHAANHHAEIGRRLATIGRLQDALAVAENKVAQRDAEVAELRKFLAEFADACRQSAWYDETLGGVQRYQQAHWYTDRVTALLERKP